MQKDFYKHIISAVNRGIKNSLNEGIDLDNFDFSDDTTGSNDIILNKVKVDHNAHNRMEAEYFKKNTSVAKIFPLYFIDSGIKKFRSANLQSSKNDDTVFFGGLDEYKIDTDKWSAVYKRFTSDINLLENTGKVNKIFSITDLLETKEEYKKLKDGTVLSKAIMKYVVYNNCGVFVEDDFIEAGNEVITTKNVNLKLLMATTYDIRSSLSSVPFDQLPDEQKAMYNSTLNTVKSIYNDVISNKELVEYIKHDFRSAAEQYKDYWSYDITLNQLYMTPDKGLVIVHTLAGNSTYNSVYKIFVYLTGNVDYANMMAQKKSTVKAANKAKKTEGINSPEFAEFKAILKSHHIVDPSAKYYVKYTEVMNSVHPEGEQETTPRKAMCIFYNTTSDKPTNSLYHYIYAYYQN